VIRTRTSNATTQDPIHDRYTRCWSLHICCSFTVVLRLWLPLYIFPAVYCGQKGMKQITWHQRCRRRRSVSWPLRSSAIISRSFCTQAVFNPLVPEDTSFPRLYWPMSRTSQGPSKLDENWLVLLLLWPTKPFRSLVWILGCLMTCCFVDLADWTPTGKLKLGCTILP
jgi:hypothetical protein